MGGMGRVVENVVDSVLSRMPTPATASWSSYGTHSSRGWRPSTPPTTSPCGASPDGSTCPPTVTASSTRWWPNGSSSKTSATAKWSSRSPWKVCWANGMPWPGGCARRPPTLKRPTCSTKRRSPGQRTALRGTGCCRVIDSPTLNLLPPNRGFRSRLNAAREFLLASRQREDPKTC